MTEEKPKPKPKVGLPEINCNMCRIEDIRGYGKVNFIRTEDAETVLDALRHGLRNIEELEQRLGNTIIIGPRFRLKQALLIMQGRKAEK